MADINIFGKLNSVTTNGIVADSEQISKDGSTVSEVLNEMQSSLSSKQDAISDLASIRSGAQAGSTAVQPSALSSKQDVITDLSTIRNNAQLGATAVQPAAMNSALTGKQDTISDLATIRSGAQAGATAVQPATMNSALAAKQDTITAGTGISVSGSAVSAKINNTLTSNATDESLSANQGKVLKNDVTAVASDLSLAKGRLDTAEEKIEAFEAVQDVKKVFATKAAMVGTGLSNGDQVKVLKDETQSNDTTIYTYNGSGFTFVGSVGQYATQEELQTVEDNLSSSIAYQFSTDLTYAVGDVVMHDGQRYVCKTAVTTAGTWDTSKWELENVQQELTNLSSEVNEVDGKVTELEKEVNGNIMSESFQGIVRETVIEAHAEQYCFWIAVKANEEIKINFSITQDTTVRLGFTDTVPTIGTVVRGYEQFIVSPTQEKTIIPNLDGYLVVSHINATEILFSTNSLVDKINKVSEDLYTTKNEVISGYDVEKDIFLTKTATDYRLKSGSNQIETTAYHFAVAFFKVHVGKNYQVSIPKTANQYALVWAISDKDSDGSEVDINAKFIEETAGTDAPYSFEYEHTDKSKSYIAICYNYDAGVPSVVEHHSVNGIEKDTEDINILTDDVSSLKQNESPLKSSIGNSAYTVTANTFNSGDVITCEDFPRSNQFGNRYAFFGKVTTFNQFVIGQGYQAYRGVSFYIDNTKVDITYNENSEQVKETFNHGLNINTFIQVNITHLDDGRFYVVINTLGGVHTHTTTYSQYLATSGALKVVNDGCTLSHVKFSATNKNFRMPLWIFGASYEGLTLDRWAGQMKSLGFFEFLINSYAGRGSAECWNDFVRCTKYGCPKFLYWCMWGNGSVADLDTYIGKVKDFCDKNGSTLIIIDRPNSLATDIQSEYSERKAVIEKYKAMGVRYVDVANAVSSNPSAANGWYEGYLSVDLKHPTEKGARAMAMRVLVDMPEIMQYGYTTNDGNPLDPGGEDN